MHDMAELNYAKFGTGSRKLVIIPGLSMAKVTDNPAALGKTFEIFGKEWTVYLIDRPYKVPEGWTNEDLSEYVVSVMESLGIDKADIAGMSQGGMIAQHIAVNHPEMVHALVLGATLSAMNDYAKEVISNWIDLAREEKYYEHNMDSFSRLYTDEYFSSKHIDKSAIAKVLLPWDKDWYIHLAQACLTGGPHSRIKEIECPTFVLGARNDMVLTGKASEDIADALGCRLHMFEKYRHAFYDEAPDYYSRVYDFLTTL